MTAAHEQEPIRTCVGCRQRRRQGALVRCVLTADGQPAVSRTAAGRGAWVCIPTGQCFDLAVRRRGFDRAWKRPISANALAELRQRLQGGER